MGDGPIAVLPPKPHLTSGFIVVQALPTSTAAIAQHVRSVRSVRCVVRRVELAMATESWVQWSWSSSKDLEDLEFECHIGADSRS